MSLLTRPVQSKQYQNTVLDVILLLNGKGRDIYGMTPSIRSLVGKGSDQGFIENSIPVSTRWDLREFMEIG